MTLDKEQMRDYMRRRRAVNQPAVNLAAVNQAECKPITLCQHQEIVACGIRTGRHFSYSKYGAPLSDLERFKAELPEPAIVSCPCCGKEWTCRRPDIQSSYCLECERSGENWRALQPYKRPQMESPNVLRDLAL
jgi:hypothetical protein